MSQQTDQQTECPAEYGWMKPGILTCLKSKPDDQHTYYLNGAPQFKWGKWQIQVYTGIPHPSWDVKPDTGSWIECDCLIPYVEGAESHAPELETLRTQVAALTAENGSLSAKVDLLEHIAKLAGDQLTALRSHLKEIAPVVEGMGVVADQIENTNWWTRENRSWVRNNLPALLSSLRAMGEIGGGENE